MLLHLVGAACIAFVPSGSGLSDKGNPSFSPEAEDEPETLGIRRSSHVTMTWIGYEDPTPHSARRSETEQALQSKGAESPAPEPTAAMPSDSPEPPSPAASRPVLPTPDPMSDPGSPIVADVPETPDLDEPLPAETEGDATVTAPPQDAPPATPGGEPVPAGGGNNAEREAVATALDGVLDVTPGKPASREGLEIITDFIRLPMTLRLKRAPRPPVMRFSFDRSGAASRVVLATTEAGEIRSTGYADLDEALITEVYRWRAAGASIEALSEQPPGSVVVVEIRVLLK
ncbi:MAG: hypothetical protein AAGG07_12005 [Planctomycetota bacterium]